ncbi:uncharacterized protein LOC141906865 isoform X3 [Tubulanus polymorphus]|uniref:uncharacterized protein LOC141906865 isoform X3 n=1 Tax=Tubulanus polymorphus TaxID=672921 RepID=UPI003DA5368B
MSLHRQSASYPTVCEVNYDYFIEEDERITPFRLPSAQLKHHKYQNDDFRWAYSRFSDDSIINHYRQNLSTRMSDHHLPPPPAYHARCTTSLGYLNQGNRSPERCRTSYHLLLSDEETEPNRSLPSIQTPLNQNSSKLKWVEPLGQWMEETQNPVPYLSFINNPTFFDRGIHSEGDLLDRSAPPIDHYCDRFIPPIEPCERFLSHMHLFDHSAPNKDELRKQKQEANTKRKAASSLRIEPKKEPTKRVLPLPASLRKPKPLKKREEVVLQEPHAKSPSPPLPEPDLTEALRADFLKRFGNDGIQFTENSNVTFQSYCRARTSVSLPEQPAPKDFTLPVTSVTSSVTDKLIRQQQQNQKPLSPLYIHEDCLPKETIYKPETPTTTNTSPEPAVESAPEPEPPEPEVEQPLVQEPPPIRKPRGGIVKKERKQKVKVEAKPPTPPPQAPVFDRKKRVSWIFGDDGDFNDEGPEIKKEETPPKTPTPPPATPTPTPPPEVELPEIQVEDFVEQDEGEKKPRWGSKVRDTSLADELRRQQLAEERRRKAALWFEKLKNRKNKNGVEVEYDSDDENGPNFDDYSFLSKYCIFNKGNLAMYKRAYEAVVSADNGSLSFEESMMGLRGVNPRLTDVEEEYLYRILDLCGYNVTDGADFKLFSVMCALSQKLSSVDQWMKNIIGRVDFKMLDMKMFMCRTLWECNVDHETNTIPLHQLCVELRAGGISASHELEVREKLSHLHALDLLDFLTYIPLFLMIHCSVVDNPLDDSRDK